MAASGLVLIHERVDQPSQKIIDFELHVFSQQDFIPNHCSCIERIGEIWMKMRLLR